LGVVEKYLMLQPQRQRLKWKQCPVHVLLLPYYTSVLTPLRLLIAAVAEEVSTASH
jgi:hypothetical protein